MKPGAIDFLVKPAPGEALLEAVRRACGLEKLGARSVANLVAMFPDLSAGT